MIRASSAVALLLLAAFAAASAAGELKEKWVFYTDNIATKEKCDGFIALMERSKKAGYTHMLLDDPYLQALDCMPESYFENSARARKAAQDLGLVVVPSIFNVGYSTRVLYHDSNLAAGLPAKNVRFVVGGGIATPDPAAVPKVINGGFEAVMGQVLAGWAPDEFSAPCVSLDFQTKHEGASALRMTAFDALPAAARGDCALTQTVKVDPFKYYRLTVWRKTSGVKASGSSVILASADGHRRLCYTNFEIDPVADYNDYVAQDSDWRQFQLTFNTLESRTMTIRVGLEGARKGTVWWDDLKVEPAGLANVLRRELTPLTVVSSDGMIQYREGLDFAPVVDEKLGAAPMPDWLSVLPPKGGIYDVWHEPPAIVLTKDSRIKDGDVLLVSYFHPHVIYSHQVNCSLEDPKVFDLFDEQMKRVKALWDAPIYVLSYDEVRVAGWELQPAGTRRATAQLLARHVATECSIVRKYAPDARIVVWSDMFDPYHNARKVTPDGRDYYLTNGGYYGSWEGIPKDVTIFSWNAKPESFKFFAGLGHKFLVAGYYDVPVAKDMARWRKAVGDTPGVYGFMYTTYTKNYRDLEEYSKALDQWPNVGQ